jgi:hypothetical protein
VAPEITATAADNGTVAIQPPLTVPGTATVTVTSEDGSASQTYTLALVPSSTSTTGTVGGTVPATLALSLGAPASHDTATIEFKQSIGRTEPLRTGSYSKTLTFTLSTTSP